MFVTVSECVRNGTERNGTEGRGGEDELAQKIGVRLVTELLNTEYRLSAEYTTEIEYCILYNVW